MSGVFIFKNST